MRAALGTIWAVPSKGWGLQGSVLALQALGGCSQAAALLNPSWAEQGLAQGHGTSQGSMWGFGRACGDTGKGEQGLGFVHHLRKRSVMFSCNH